MTGLFPYSAIVGGTLSDNVVRYTSGQFGNNGFVAARLNSGGGDSIVSTSATGNVVVVTTSSSHHVGLFSTIKIVGSNTANNNGTFYVVSVPTTSTTSFSVIAPTGTNSCASSCGVAYVAIDQVRVCKTQVTAQDQNGLLAIGSTNPLGITLDSQQATNYLCPPSQALNANVVNSAMSIPQTPLVPGTYTVPAGQWRINWYIASSATCAVPGPAQVVLTFGFTDDTAARTIPNITIPLGVNGPTSYTQGTFVVYTGTGTAINYSTVATNCTTGTLGYNLRLTAEQIQ
jgi:hypothetical protein